MKCSCFVFDKISTQNHAVQNVLLDNQLLSLKHEEQLLLHGQDLLQSITASSSAVQTYSVRTTLMSRTDYVGPRRRHVNSDRVAHIEGQIQHVRQM